MNVFTVGKEDVRAILIDYGIQATIFSIKELQRYDYEKDDPATKEVRLIVKAETEDGRSFVIRFRNETNVPTEVIEAQSGFASLLYAHGIETPQNYLSNGSYARKYSLNGYDVTVTVEDFKAGELRVVDEKTAEQTGTMLARMHEIAELNDWHVKSAVLFDPLTENDLFSYDGFIKHEEYLRTVDETLFNQIVHEHTILDQAVRSFETEPRYAVQGDISDCNLYRTEYGTIGVFDFNWCGDNNLFYDAVMQGIFESRLMDYPEEMGENRESLILTAFLRGYHRIRPFTEKQKAVFPSLHALVSAFDYGDIITGKRSLTKAVKSRDPDATRQWMETIYRRERILLPLPV